MSHDAETVRELREALDELKHLWQQGRTLEMPGPIEHARSLARELDDGERESDSRPVNEPETLDIVPAPPGRTCQMWGSRGEEPKPCDRDADWILVFDRNPTGDRREPRNVLGCSKCIHRPHEAHESIRGDA